MKPILSRAHGVFDYLTVALFALAPNLFGLTGTAATLAYVLAAVPLSAQEHEPTAATNPPERRVYFEAAVESPFLAPLLSQHGCSVPETGRIRVVLPGRVFDPPIDLTADGGAGRSDPLASMSTQWALLAAGDVERAVAGWVPEERATARALMSDPAAVQRYQGQAAAIEKARVDALVWFEDAGGEPVAALIAADNPTGFTLGMPSGFRRGQDGEFLLTIAVARDARFGIVGAAAQEGTLGHVGSEGDDANAADTVGYAEACGGGD